MSSATDKPLEEQAIITPASLYDELNREFHFDFDPCPYPRPEGFDGLTARWGTSNYVNPLFVGFMPWVRKALAERDAGHTVVLTMPVYAWIAKMIEEASEIRVRRDWYWETPKGERRKPSQPLVVWILKPKEARKE